MHKAYAIHKAEYKHCKVAEEFVMATVITLPKVG